MKGKREDGGPAELWLIRSRTYMNDSGRGLSQARVALDLDPHEILVAFDDIDLPLGKIRLRESGGSGGQNGMKSVIDALGTQKVPRLRLGIRGDRVTVDTADYVLNRFDKDEREVAAEMIEDAADAVEMVFRAGLIAAMNRYN
jgi:PTH1 family peptidyl-tRNA hydrolase